MNLEQLLGDDLYAQVKAKIDEVNKDKENLEKIRFVDLSEGNYVSKEKYQRLEGEKQTLQEQFDTQSQTIKSLKKDYKDNEELQNQISKLNEDLKASQKKGIDLQRTYTLKDAISKEGCVDPDYLIYKEGGLDKFTFDAEGNPVGIAEIAGRYKEDRNMAHLFKQEPTGYNPHSGNGTPAVNPFAKESFNLTAQTKLFKENPEHARELAAEAGIKL
ncbi:MAG: phage scaffolding protein [Eubacterium sp.]